MPRARLRSLALVLVSGSAAACSDESPNAEAGDSQDEGGTQADSDTQTDTQGDTQGETDTQGDGDGDALRPNWHQDLAPVIHANCVGCHAEGGIAPFGLDTYAKAAPWAPMMNDVVSSGLMPPWGAIETDECQPSHDWRNDLRLPDETKQLFADWLAQGTPEGDPADAAPLPEPPSLELQNTSAVLQNPSPFSVVGPQDSFVCMAIDPGVDQDVWITGVQMVPDNIAVVHHVLMYVDSMALSDDMIDANGTFPCEGFVSFDGAMQIGTWVPGAVPTEMPPGVGLPMPAGSRIILAYHYHPNGAEAIDQSSVALRWTEQAPEVNAVMGLFGNGDGLEPGPNDPGGVPVFMIPANVSDHTETMSITIPEFVPPIDLFTVGTHMHYVGVDMRVWIERDGQEICLVQTPRWDFNWQRNYDIDAPLGDMPKIQGGDVIKLRCTYDNTLANPFLVKALAEQGLSEPQPVVLGEASLDEMCLLLFGVATDLPIDQL